MKLLAIPNFGMRISPRLDYAESMQLLTVNSECIVKKEIVKILACNNLERINFIIRLRPDVIICDGISELMYNKLKESKIIVKPWIHGAIEQILTSYLNGKL